MYVYIYINIYLCDIKIANQVTFLNTKDII